MGNIKSVYNAFKHLGAEPIVAKKPTEIDGDRIVLPGVGAFANGIKNLEPFIPRIKEASSKSPLLGICLGMQVFFESSEEPPSMEGMKLLRGKVVRVQTGLKLPHIGWNLLKVTRSNCPLFRGIDNGYVYFTHSYHAVPEEDVVTAVVDYGCTITAAVWKNNIFGTQFHPEKSGAIGLKILRNFLEL